MTNVRVWAWSAVALIALLAGALLAGGAVSFAQDDSPTATPAPSASTAPSATTAPSDKSGDHNCPNMGTGSTAPTRSRSVTSGASGGA